MNHKVREEVVQILRSVQITGHVVRFIGNESVMTAVYNELSNRKDLSVKMHNPTHIDVRKNAN